MVHGSVFSGIGGFDLAAEWMGWDNLFNCDIEEQNRRLLKYYWPEAENFSDIKTSDFTKYAKRIDIISGGDPCQPSSFAGLRMGFDDPRFLWPEMFRVIKQVNPRWVVNENVEGTITNGMLDRKISDLENEGYTCWPPLVIPANAVGSLHRRNRVWLVAHSQRDQQPQEKPCSRSTRRVGRQFKPLAWHTDWQAAVNFFRGVDDGVPNILDRTDGTRNAIVPQVALQIFKAIEQYEYDFLSGLSNQ